MRTVLYNNNQFTISSDHIDNKIVLHIDFNSENWSHNFMKKIKYILSHLEKHFLSKGVTEIYVAPKKDNLGSIKLAELNGFVEVYQDNNLHLMKKIIN